VRTEKGTMGSFGSAAALGNGREQCVASLRPELRL
jgi:hypothetical protein